MLWLWLTAPFKKLVLWTWSPLPFTQNVDLTIDISFDLLVFVLCYHSVCVTSCGFIPTKTYPKCPEDNICAGYMLKICAASPRDAMRCKHKHSFCLFW